MSTNVELGEVVDQATFVIYLTKLRAELAAGPAEEAWANIDLANFLEAMQAWATDWKGPAQSNPWRHTADVLTAAMTYE